MKISMVILLCLALASTGCGGYLNSLAEAIQPKASPTPAPAPEAKGKQLKWRDVTGKQTHRPLTQEDIERIEYVGKHGVKSEAKTTKGE